MNVYLGLGDPSSSSFSLVARDLERIGADVVAFQELQSDFQNIQSLGTRLGLPNFVASGSSSMNVGVLSRYPFRSQEWITTVQRPILLVRPDVPGVDDDPWIAVVHLKCCGSPGGSEQQTRAAELYKLRATLRSKGITSSKQVIILGDFNLVSDVDASYETEPMFAPASADAYFQEEEILKLPLRHADGVESFTWRSNGSFPSRDLDHIMLSGPLRERSLAHEIYEPRKDSIFSGKAKFGDAPATSAEYSSDHLPIFSDVVIQDINDGFSNETTPPGLSWSRVTGQELSFVNRAVSSATSDVTATDNQDPGPVVTVYPLNPVYSTFGTKKITYMARDRMGNMQTMDRTVTVANWGQGGVTHNLQWPSKMQISVNGQGTVYAQIYIPGWTETVAKVAPNVQCWIGVNDSNTDPAEWAESCWKVASLNSTQGVEVNADEYKLNLQGSDTGLGTFYYAARWQISGGAYGYGGIASVGGSGGAWDGAAKTAGVLTVGNTFGLWSAGGQVTRELVTKYAIGGSVSPSGSSESPGIALQGDGLSLTAIVRKDDPKLTVVAEWTNDLSGEWKQDGVSSGTDGLSQPENYGLERRRFTVLYDSATEPKKFMRLRATLEP